MQFVHGVAAQQGESTLTDAKIIPETHILPYIYKNGDFGLLQLLGEKF